MRVTTVFNKLLALQGAFVQRVEFTADGIVVGVRRATSLRWGRQGKRPRGVLPRT